MPDPARAVPSYVELVHTMGTVVTLDVRAAERPAGLAAAFAEAGDRLHEIDETFSTWRQDSWVSRLVHGQVALDDCPREVRDVVRLAGRLSDLTGGLFSPHWQADPARPGADPTGLVKGWAAQQASDILLAHGCVDHVVNAAGDLVLSGAPLAVRDGSPWRVGISDPVTPGALAGVVELLPGPGTRSAVATSGPAERGRHVVDPRTGTFPGAVVSATVLVETGPRHPQAGAVADACATALVAAGEQAPAVLAELTRHEVRGFLVHADGRLTDPSGCRVV